MDDMFCGKCNKICYGEVLFARDEYFHQDCFKCKACLKDLMTNGFYSYENEFYCSRDYQKLFGVKCTACGQFIEGDAVSVYDDSFHESCFACASCNNAFAPGAKVNMQGDDYLCDNCLPGSPKDQPSPGAEGACAGCGNEIKTGQALLALDSQWHLWCFTCNKCGCLLSGEYMGRDGVPFCEKDYQDEFGVSCAGCGGYITGKVLQAGEKHYHPQCSRCAKCGQMFGEGEEMYLQGSEIWHPECSDEYQREEEENERLAYERGEEFAKEQREKEERDKAERERIERERADKVRADREKAERERAEKERAERERAEKERAERERAEREHAERERAEKERAERERAERERVERERAEKARVEREKAERERAERERAERERVERERAERERAERERAERERRERERAERERAEAERAREEERRAKSTSPDMQRESPRENPLRSASPADTLAYSAKPFGTQKTMPSSISINFKPRITDSSAGKWKPPETKSFEPPKTTPTYRPSQYSRMEIKTVTTTTRRTESKSDESERSLSPPASKENAQPPVVNGFQKASSVSSDEGGPARPPPPPTRGSSQNWKSRISTTSYSVKRATSPPTSEESPRDHSFAPMNAEIDVRSANRPLSYIESASKRDDSRVEPQKQSVSVTSVSKTTDDAVPSAIYRRLPNRDRDAMRENRKSLPAMPDYTAMEDYTEGYEFVQMRDNGMSRNETNAHHRRSLPSLDKYDNQEIKASTTYPYDVLKSSNYKMPKEIDRSRREAYLTDEDFVGLFKVDREGFYKMPAWKQRDMKKKVSLF